MAVVSGLAVTMIGLDGRPQQKSLPQMLREWVEFRLRTVTRRCEYRLVQVNDRLHILAGRLLAFLSIDKVIRTIRAADEPKAELMAKFRLSQIQAEDIRICEAVQRNLDAGIYRTGPLSPRHEVAVGWFQDRLRSAVTAVEGES